jgi:superoxide dismutase, Fe-Mn family
MADYALPDLAYDYGALEPYISGALMELHHSKHHLAYVNGVNTTVDALQSARDQESFGTLGTLEKNLAFHLGGHVNHSVFWANMSPEGGDKPVGALAEQIEADFGSFDKFRAHFQANAVGVQGSGWSILAWDTLAQKLYIIQLYDHQGNAPVCLVPLLMLDLWEHAYYLDYQANRPEFITQWWNIVNWADVQGRFDRARTQTQGLILP